jgi:hypothetical protein
VLSLVRALVEANGAEYANALDLSTEDNEGNTQHIATGDALLSLLETERRQRSG